MTVAFDLIVAVALVALAWRVVTGADLFTVIVLFIVFGLVMALAWVRLDAPDIALAEAAIGAGLTGALLLDAVAQIEGERRAPPVRRAVAAAGENGDETSGDQAR
jgi:energy-converting hydrogenase B subunit D